MFKIQLDYHGRHRILLMGELGTLLLAIGEWAAYASVATLQYGGRTYMAMTQGGVFGDISAETVYDITPRPTTLDNSQEWIDSEGVDHQQEQVE
jgi:hypothetical protein